MRRTVIGHATDRNRKTKRFHALHIDDAKGVALIAGVILLVFIVVMFVQPKESNRRTADQPLNAPAISGERESSRAGAFKENDSAPSLGRPDEITSLETSWRIVDRELWVPEIRMTVKNVTPGQIDEIHFKAVFLDGEMVLKGRDIIDSLQSIPAGYARGPVFLHGTVGYTSDFAFITMLSDPSKKWRFDLYEGERYSGPWTKIRSGLVDVPEAYRSIQAPEHSPQSPPAKEPISHNPNHSTTESTTEPTWPSGAAHP